MLLSAPGLVKNAVETCLTLDLCCYHLIRCDTSFVDHSALDRYLTFRLYLTGATALAPRPLGLLQTLAPPDEPVRFL